MAPIIATQANRHVCIHAMAQNILVAFCIGAPGYTQVKFNVLNYHIIHNSKDRRPGIVTGIACSVLFFGLSDDVLQWLPRFVDLSIYAMLFRSKPLFPRVLSRQ